MCGEGPHVPHPPELQLPHVLLDVPITLSGFSIALSPFEKAVHCCQGSLTNGCSDAASKASGSPVKLGTFPNPK